MARSRLEEEIQDQGAALRRRADAGREAAREASGLLERAGVRYLILAGRGSSDNAARYGQYLLGSHARLSTGLAAPWLFAGDFEPPSLSDGGVVAISQSGGSPDVAAVLAGARKQGRPAIAITGNPDSAVARAAQLVVPLGVGEERSVAATKSYTASLHALAQLALALRPDAMMARELARLPGALTELALSELAERERFDALDAASHITVVGRGLNYATAHELALKLRELSGTPAEAFSPPDLLHGPVAALGRSTCLWLVSAGGGRQLDAETAAALRTRAGTTVVVSDDEALLAGADIAVPLPRQPAWLAPFAAVVPGQVAALRLAELRGVDVDRPHGLKKVTLTL